ncbi:MAG: hypothetical protein ACRC0L_01360 [Angustibacter sp.]
MPTKSAGSSRYHVDGKVFTWLSDDGEDVTLPLRLKVGALRKLAKADDADIESMFALVLSVAPDAGDQLDELDVNEFSAMFEAWQREYQLLSGATLGEASSSST